MPEVGRASVPALKVRTPMRAPRSSMYRCPHKPLRDSGLLLVATAEASSNLARYDGVHYGYRAKRSPISSTCTGRSRGEGFGKEVKRRICSAPMLYSSGLQGRLLPEGLESSPGHTRKISIRPFILRCHTWADVANGSLPDWRA